MEFFLKEQFHFILFELEHFKTHLFELEHLPEQMFGGLFGGLTMTYKIGVFQLPDGF